MIEPPKYPAVKVQLSGADNNALAVMATVSAALFLEESTSGDYDDLLVTAMKWVDVR